ncbi:MAG: substrate-binding domain-containing protein [Cyanobacteria bacterium J06623_7]
MQIIKLKFRQVGERGFFVTLSCTQQPWEVEGYLSLMPQGLKVALNQWQASYRQLDTLRSLAVAETDLPANWRVVPKSVRVNSSTECLNAVKTELNLWLNNLEGDWQTIRDALIAFSNQFQSAELQITLDSQNIDLCRLPWQEWELFQQYYPQTEIAISTPTAKDMAIASNPVKVNSKKIRILLVVGKSEGISTQSDLDTIERLLAKQAEIVYLLQPSLKELAAALWCDRGYHIFIFTGHSGSNNDGTIGWIAINDREQLTIPEFKDAFKQAIENGLQLAIFNSCDGLGLADRLSELNLGQVIVMSEPVPDLVAIEFLEHLFSELINQRSLFSAVHRARKKLEHLNSRYPGAPWLPTLCVKPRQNYFTWHENDPVLLKPAISGNMGQRLARTFLGLALCILLFISGLSLNILLPQLNLEFIAQPIAALVKQSTSVTAELNLPSGTWQYGGSTTWQPINRLVRQKLGQKHPDFQLIHTDHAALPNGSGTGIRMLIKGQISFALSSRPVSDREYDAAIVRGKILKQVPVAIDGVVAVVNPQLNLDGLTTKQLGAIYRGQITNWKAVGGPDLPIIPYARPSQSGTTEFWRTNILKSLQYGGNVVFVEESTAAIAKVADMTDLGGIYFTSIAEVINNCDIKPLALARRSASIPVGIRQGDRCNVPAPSTKVRYLNLSGLRTGEYPLIRRLFIIIEINSPVDEEVGEAYKNFMLTQEGQNLIARAGFIPIRSF